MKVLVLNCGSSSVKFALIETDLQRIADDTELRLAEGMIAKIGLAVSSIDYRAPGRDYTYADTAVVLDHQDALVRILALLTVGESAVIASSDEIGAVGHRFVHGGEEFASSVLIDDDVLAAIVRCTTLAPLHNPHNLKGYQVASELLPGRPHAAVFDTAFHQTMPRAAYLYGLPWSVYKKHGIRRYGFHGTSHRFVYRRLGRLLKKEPEQVTAITLHLGNGCSAAAIELGRSIDTSMGFTPLEGLMMGTRTGDLDPAVILHIMAREEIGLHEASGLLNKFSGLAGISGVSSDMRELLAAARDGNDRAEAAVEVFTYRIRKYIGGYLAALGRLPDAVVFTGGIGENAPEVRRRVLSGLEHLGIHLDAAANAAIPGAAREGRITLPQSSISVWVIPTDEERVIARDTVRGLAAHDRTLERGQADAPGA